MALYEDDALFPTPHGTSTGQAEIRATLKAYLDSGAQLAFGESLVFLAGARLDAYALDDADAGRFEPEGCNRQVVRRQTDGSWKYVIDNPDGSALLGHDYDGARPPPALVAT